MDPFYTLASIVLFSFTIYVLARADGWTRATAALLTSATLAVPTALVTVVFTLPLPAIVVETVVGVAPVGAMIVLFALAKSVAGKIAGRDGQDR